MRDQRRFFEYGSQNSVATVLFLIAFFIAMFFIARGIFTILSWVAPVLLIITLVINYRIVLNYGKWIWNLIKERLPLGILAVIFTVIGFPVVVFFLFAKALFYRKSKQMQQQYEEEKLGRYTDYEIVEEDTLELDDRHIRQHVDKDDTDDYEKLFK